MSVSYQTLQQGCLGLPSIHNKQISSLIISRTFSMNNHFLQCVLSLMYTYILKISTIFRYDHKLSTKLFDILNFFAGARSSFKLVHGAIESKRLSQSYVRIRFQQGLQCYQKHTPSRQDKYGLVHQNCLDSFFGNKLGLQNRNDLENIDYIFILNNIIMIVFSSHC